MRTQRKRRNKRIIKAALIILCAAVLYRFADAAQIKLFDSDVQGKNGYDFSKISYYQEELQKRYEDYFAKNPKLDAEDVVWHVNVDLDKESYDTPRTIDKKEEDRTDLLINKHNKFRKGYEPYSLVTGLSGIMVTPKTAEALDDMARDAKKHGLKLSACSGYRTYDKQKSLYDKYKQEKGKDYADRYSARAGFSEHHTGRAVDLISPKGYLDDFEKTAECKWVHENAWKYGFILRYPKGYEHITGYSYESWHITYVGKDISQRMYYKNIKTFEEYCGKYMV